MQKIVPCLGFNNQAEEALNFYTGIFKDSKVKDLSRYGEGAPMPKDTLLVATFEIEGQSFMVLNGGSFFTGASPSISLLVNCQTQEEIDHLWEALSADGGATGRCGWLKDRFGVSWQIAPMVMGELMQDKDKAKVARVMQAMMQMTKLDIARLQAAHAG